MHTKLNRLNGWEWEMLDDVRKQEKDHRCIQASASVNFSHNSAILAMSSDNASAKAVKSRIRPWLLRDV